MSEYNWREITMSEYNWREITEYRKLEIKVMVQFISNLLKSQQSSEFTKGALAMLDSILNLPLDMVSTPEEKEYVEIMMAKEFVEVKVDLVHKALRG